MLEFIAGMFIGRVIYIAYDEYVNYKINKEVEEILPAVIDAWIKSEERYLRS